MRFNLVRNLRRKVSESGFLAYLGFILYYINFFSFSQQGITRASQAALMAAPAAGSGWLATLTPGHRLEIIAETDIWFKVKWQDQVGFIRKQNLLVLP